MMSHWRLSTFSGVLLSCYFIPVWAIAAFGIVMSPVHGLFERPNVAVAMFISDYLHAAPLVTIRFAWLLAFSKLTVVAFFALFAVMVVRASARKTRNCDEPLAIGLSLASIVSFISMVCAAQVNEQAALQLHATELLLLLGTSVLMLVEQPKPEAAQPRAPAIVATAPILAPQLRLP